MSFRFTLFPLPSSFPLPPSLFFLPLFFLTSVAGSFQFILPQSQFMRKESLPVKWYVQGKSYSHEELFHVSLKAMMESVFSSLTSSCKIEMISCIKSHEDWFIDGGMFLDEGGMFLDEGIFLDEGGPDTVCWFEAAVIDSDPVKQLIFCF